MSTFLSVSVLNSYELEKFLSKIENNESFALSRWGDGEYRLLKGDYLIRSDGELSRKRTWTYTPSQEPQRKNAKIIVDCFILFYLR